MQLTLREINAKDDPYSQSFNCKKWSGLPHQISGRTAHVGHRHPFNVCHHLISINKADQITAEAGENES